MKKQKVRDYVFVYRYEDEEYELIIPAKSLNEAVDRKNHFGMARYEGKVEFSIPLSPWYRLTWLKRQDD